MAIIFDEQGNPVDTENRIQFGNEKFDSEPYGYTPNYLGANSPMLNYEGDEKGFKFTDNYTPAFGNLQSYIAGDTSYPQNEETYRREFFDKFQQIPNLQRTLGNERFALAPTGIMKQAPLMQGVSDMSLIDETTNDEQDQNYIDPVNKKSSLKDSLSNMGKKFGLSSLLGLITGNPILGLIGRGAKGLGALNDRMQNSDFGQSRTGAEYFMKRRERKQGERARTANADVYASADRQGFTNDRGGFSTNRADRAGTSVGSGQFNSKTSRGRTGY